MQDQGDALLVVGNRQSVGAIAIDAKDDGVGCDRVSFGNGLRGMRERVEAVRGSLEVISARGKGFEVRVMLPA